MASPFFLLLRPCTRPRCTPVAAACLIAGIGNVIAALPAVAQQVSTTLEPVVVTGRRTDVDISGFGDVPLSRLPMQASTTSSIQLRERGVQRLSDIVSTDASLGDAYNSEGYWDFLSIRGFTLDNRSNYRRDGLPINAETSIPLDNKSRIEVLKGLSGMQAGISAPGGLVNQVVKRPDTRLRSVELGWREPGSAGVALDISQRFGGATGEAYGLRINAAYDDLEPQLRHADGHSRMLAVAGDWRLATDTVLEAEIETSRRVQPSQAAFSLLGNVVPEPGDPNLNLNNQPWSLPVVFEGHTASVRLRHRLAPQWWGSVHGMTQRLRTDDRIAFPFGCSAENNFDRFCSDGTFDYYDFRSENERRRSDALDLGVEGELTTEALAHSVRAGVLFANMRKDVYESAFNFLVPPGNVDGRVIVAPDPSLTQPASRLVERSTEWYLRARTRWDDVSQLWWGLRYTLLGRSGSDSEADYAQDFITPFIAYSRDLKAWLGEGWMGYASWGQGVETAVTPSLPQYGDAGGEPLPALRSRQAEAGLKLERDDWNGAVAIFEIQRPQTTDVGVCDPLVAGSCIRVLDGRQVHRGIEAQLVRRIGAGWQLGGSVTLLRADREGSVDDPTLNGKRPPNVPERSLRAYTRWTPAAVPRLDLDAWVTHEGDRTILPGNEDLRIPGWTRLDAAFSYDWGGNGGGGASAGFTLRGGIKNLTDERAWREAPLQFEHAFLFPLAPRTAWLALEARM